MMKFRFLLWLLTFCTAQLAAQQIICFNIDFDSVQLKESFEDNEMLNDALDVEYLSQTQQFFKDIIFQITTESISNAAKTNLFSQLYVSGKGKVVALAYKLSSEDSIKHPLVITREQHARIKAKIQKYVEGFTFNVKQKKNWQSLQIQTIPPLQRKRFYKDYLDPNPKPTAPENTKLGAIQRLANQCTDLWEQEGTRNPGDLRFLGLMHVCFITLDADNPMFKNLQHLAPTESLDSLRAQIFQYMYAHCPIVRAKYGFYQPNPIYKFYVEQTCSCVVETYPKRLQTEKTEDADDEIFYAVQDECKAKALVEDYKKMVIAYRDSLNEAALANNVENRVAVNTFLSGLDGAVPFGCPYILARWERSFVHRFHSDTMTIKYTSTLRQNLNAKLLEALAENWMDSLQNRFVGASEWQANRSEIDKIKKELKKWNKKNDTKFSLVTQLKEKQHYIEEIAVYNSTTNIVYFLMRVVMEKANGARKLVRLEYVPQDKIKSKVSIPK